MRPLEWIALFALAAVFAPAFRAMAGVWFSVDYYSHGVLVPVVALWSAYQQPALRRPALERRDRRGFALIGVALFAYAAGLGIGSVSLQGLAVVACVAGFALQRFGASGLRALAFPIGFLAFMVPVPDVWLTPVIVQLQLWVSAAATALLSLLGFELVREGNVLLLPSGASLFVAEACSGITSLVTLTPLAVVLAAVSERRLARRLVIVASVVPLAMLGNLLRVVGTVLASSAFGVERATSGPVHDLAGVASFALSCALLVGFGALLRRYAPEVRGGTRAPSPG
jgi:exosortase